VPTSRYRESRILVRSICRLPDQKNRGSEYQQNLERLRAHFRQFNVDVAEICDWFLRLRKQAKEQSGGNHLADFGVLGNVLLEPRDELTKLSADFWQDDVDESDEDNWRLAIFNEVANLNKCEYLGICAPPAALRTAMTAAASESSPTTRQLFERLKRYDGGHRFVLLKAAAEWVVARFRRRLQHLPDDREKWHRDKEEWERENIEVSADVWEKAHPQFTEVFKRLVDPERKGPKQGQRGIRKRVVRMCGYGRLKTGTNNCQFNGKQGHDLKCLEFLHFASACKKFSSVGSSASDLPRQIARSVAERRERDGLDLTRTEEIADAVTAFIKNCEDSGEASKLTRENKKSKKPAQSYFYEAAAMYVEHRLKSEQSGKNEQQAHGAALESIYATEHGGNRKKWFEHAWAAYLKAMNLKVETILHKHGCLPHCDVAPKGKVEQAGQLDLNGRWEKSRCRFNQHTDLCMRYLDELKVLKPETLALEAKYRAWRKEGFLAPPSVPSFRSPSSCDLPMPKIFGKDHFKPDFENSVIELPVGDAPGEWVNFGFAPWPDDYEYRWQDINVTSVHVHCIGNRTRIGFRFERPHEESRFHCLQDDLDSLRRKYRLRSEERELLKQSQELLKKSFKGDFDKELTLLAVDLGERGAAVALYRGGQRVALNGGDEILPISKIDYCYPLSAERRQEIAEAGKTSRFPLFDEDEIPNRATDSRGLCKEHVARRHMTRLTEGAKRVAKHRNRKRKSERPAILGRHDHRRLQRHIKGMNRDWARHNASQIASIARKYRSQLIVFESLRDQKVPGRDELNTESQLEKKKLAMYSYGRIRQKVAEKAVELGMRVVTVPEFLSSQHCWKCGCRNKKAKQQKQQHYFECPCAMANGKAPNSRDSNSPCPKNCTAQRLDSDVNAARFLARVFLGDFPLPQRPNQESRANRKEGKKGT